MQKLNVQYPNEIIRVSEVIPQIISYIQKIIDNGFAYVVSDGSVYFDLKAYAKAGYAISETEDEETTTSFKRNSHDFALWKGRETTDVGFDADFIFEGSTIKCYGRPGWHIECSTMMDQTLGSDIDIHLGGIDLKFPRHTISDSSSCILSSVVSQGYNVVSDFLPYRSPLY